MLRVILSLLVVFAALCVCAATVPAYGASLRVELLPCGPLPEPFPSSVTRIAALPGNGGGDPSREPETWMLKNEAGALPLSDGIPFDHDPAWTLYLTNDHFWTRPLEVPAGADGVTVPIWPKAILRGKVRVPRSENLPTAMDLRLKLATEGAAEVTNSEPRDSRCRLDSLVEPCAIDAEGRFRCGLPAGMWNVVMKSPGWAARHLWEATLEPSHDFDAGDVALRHGATLLGEVTTVDGPADPRITRVWAVPVAAAEHNLTPRVLREEDVGTRTALNEQGYFVFEDLEPGRYVLAIHQPGYALNARHTVRLEENLETAMRNPIVLTPPTRLDVRVEPPATPDGEPWDVRLYLDDAVATSGGVVARGVTKDGQWSDSSLQPGSYRVAVFDARGNRLAEEGPLHVESEEVVFLPITLDLVEVEGVVELGDEVVSAATIWFGGRSGIRSVEVQTDDEGLYTAHLPEAGTWKVVAAAEEPPVSYTGKVEIPEGGGEVDLELPDTRIGGAVLTENGEVPAPLPAVGMHARAAVEGTVAPRVYEDGRFEARGMEPGTYELQARGEDGISELVEVSVQEGVESPEITLILRKREEVRGTVISNHGGVQGAEVLLLPFDAAGRDLQASIPPVETDRSGDFQARVPPGTESLLVVVYPPGFGLTVTRTGIEPSRILVAAAESTLILRDAMGENFRRSAVVVEGEVLPITLLARWSMMNKAEPSAEDRDLVVPAVPAGVYRYCRLAPDELELVMTGLAVPQTCSEGAVAPGSELVLSRP